MKSVVIIPGWRASASYERFLGGLYTQAGFTVRPTPKLSWASKSIPRIGNHNKTRRQIVDVTRGVTVVHLLSAAGYYLPHLPHQQVVITESTPLLLDATTVVTAVGLTCTEPRRRLMQTLLNAVGYPAYQTSIHTCIRQHPRLLMLVGPNDPVTGIDTYTAYSQCNPGVNIRIFPTGGHGRLFWVNDFSAVTDFAHEHQTPVV